jgi:phosphopantetheinyl transferase (holo-ACP synthase)
MRSFFASTERDEICGMPITDQVKGFFRGWTAKEAYVKAIGHGSAFGLDEVETAAINSNAPSLRRIRGSQERAAGWKLTTRIVAIAARTVVLSVVTGALDYPQSIAITRPPTTGARWHRNGLMLFLLVSVGNLSLSQFFNRRCL